MFDANKVSAGLAQVENCDQLIALLSQSVGYTFGDRFALGNYKIGRDDTVADADHPDWHWTPITGSLISLAICRIPRGADVVLFSTGYRNGDRDKSVLCIYSSLNDLATSLVTKLASVDGNSTIGAKLATLLGYGDWSVVRSYGTNSDKYLTYVDMQTTGVVTSEINWIAAIPLDLPDDGTHLYQLVYDPYADVLMCDAPGFPKFMATTYNQYLDAWTLIMAKSTYDADGQNTVDVIHASLAKALASASNIVSQNALDVAGLIAANGAIYAAISNMPVFGNRFIDVVEAQQRIDANSQYIPRP